MENYDICRRYGLYDGSIKNQALTPLYGSNIEDRLDNLIEIGLLNGKNISLDFFSSYAKRYPSAIVTMDQNNIMDAENTRNQVYKHLKEEIDQAKASI